MPSSWFSLRVAARLAPSIEEGRESFVPVSEGWARGCEQHVLVHMSGNVIFSEARCWRRSFFVTGWKRKAEKARWRSPCDMLVIRWQTFLEAEPRISSSKDRTMHCSSMRRICSSS